MILASASRLNPLPCAPRVLMYILSYLYQFSEGQSILNFVPPCRMFGIMMHVVDDPMDLVAAFASRFSDIHTNFSRQDGGSC